MVQTDPTDVDSEPPPKEEWVEMVETEESETRSPRGNPVKRSDSQLVTVRGTVKRGFKAGQIVEVQLEMTAKEVQEMQMKNSHYHEENETLTCCPCGVKNGPHVIMLSLVSIPVAFIVSLCVAFYMGSLTWYNLFLYFSEEKSVWHKIFICPVLILTFPLTVFLSATGIGMYASIVQISWFLSGWIKEFRDFEKGFYGWVCNGVDLAECSPYEIVVLDDDEPTVTLPQSDSQRADTQGKQLSQTKF